MKRLVSLGGPVFARSRRRRSHLDEMALGFALAKTSHAPPSTRKEGGPMKPLVCCAVLLTGLVFAGIDGDSRSREFQSGNASFDSGNYQEAINKYEGLLKEDPSSGAVHYNLGNAYYRNKQFGHALFQFRQAESLLPRDPDVRFNIGYTRKHVVDKLEDKRTWNPSEFIPITERESLLFLIAASLLFWSGMLVLVFRNRSWLVAANRVSMAILVIALVIVIVKGLGSDSFGVVTAPETGVFSASGKDSTLLFTLHEGTEFTVAEFWNGDWIKIQLADGKRGWVKRQDIVAAASGG